MADLTFSSEVKELTVKIDDKDYILIEALGEAANQYNNVMMGGITLGRDGKPTKIQDIAESNSVLLSYCFFSIGEEGNRKEVSLEQLKSWPERIQSKLISSLKEISDLKEEGGDERESLLNALNRDDTPISLQKFRDWAEKLLKEDEESYEPLWDLIKSDNEEKAKND